MLATIKSWPWWAWLLIGAFVVPMVLRLFAR